MRNQNHLTVSELACAYSYLSGWPIIGIKLPKNAPYTELLQAAPCLTLADYQLMSDGSGFIVCENMVEATGVYEDIVGDAGSATNAYAGNVRVYAYLIEEGVIVMENT